VLLAEVDRHDDEALVLELSMVAGWVKRREVTSTVLLDPTGEIAKKDDSRTRPQSFSSIGRAGWSARRSASASGWASRSRRCSARCWRKS
jgi:hypothetical protein